MLGRYYRQQLESGDGQGLADLDDLLWADEPELARTAFERAVDAGNRRAVISLATHRRVVSGDYEGALALYQQAVTSRTRALPPRHSPNWAKRTGVFTIGRSAW